MNLDGHTVVDADSLLRVTDRTLGDVIERVLGTAPERRQQNHQRARTLDVVLDARRTGVEELALQTRSNPS